MTSPGAHAAEMLPGYRLRQVGKGLQYWDADHSTASRSTPAFTDHGEMFFVNALDPHHIETVLALAADRFGRVAIAGTPEFVAECRRVATDLRLTIDVGSHHLPSSLRPDRDVGWRRLPDDVGKKKAQPPGIRRTIDPARLRGDDPGLEIER